MGEMSIRALPVLIAGSLIAGVMTVAAPAQGATSDPAFELVGSHPHAATQPTAAGRSIHVLYGYEGKLYTGYGDFDKNTGPISIDAWDPQSATWQTEHVAATEQIDNFQELAPGEGLFAPLVDFRGADIYGPEYARYVNGVWQDVEAKDSYGYHVWDIASYQRPAFTHYFMSGGFDACAGGVLRAEVVVAKSGLDGPWGCARASQQTVGTSDMSGLVTAGGKVWFPAEGGAAASWGYGNWGCNKVICVSPGDSPSSATLQWAPTPFSLGPGLAVSPQDVRYKNEGVYISFTRRTPTYEPHGTLMRFDGERSAIPLATNAVSLARGVDDQGKEVVFVLRLLSDGATEFGSIDFDVLGPDDYERIGEAPSDARSIGFVSGNVYFGTTASEVYRWDGPLSGQAPADDDPPVPSTQVTGVRPGGPVTFRGGQGLNPKTTISTLNFMFYGSDGHTYIGSCGHCIQTGNASGTWQFGSGTAPIAYTPEGKAIGEVVFAACCGYSSVNDPSDPNSLRDLSLIRVYDGVEVDPEMPVFGGPTGINGDLSATPTTVHYCGQGSLGPFTVSPNHPVDCHTALASSTSQPGYVLFTSDNVGGGDSGSPVISGDKRALGILVGLAGQLKAHQVTAGGVTTGTYRAVRVAPSIADAERALGIGLQLARPGDPAPTPSQSPSSTPSASSSPSPSEPAAKQTSLEFTSASATSGYYSDQATIEVGLVDDAGEPIAGAEVVFEMVSEESATTWTVTTDSSGIASSDRRLDGPPGTYNLTARFDGEEGVYEGSADQMFFQVEREQTVTTLQVSGKGSKRSLVATLSEDDGPAIEGREIVFLADGKEIGRDATDPNGVAAIEAPPGYRGGQHDFLARFDSDRLYAASSGRPG